MKTLQDRFWPKVDKSRVGGCWEWIAGMDKDGYGVFWFNNRNHKAHRIAYELFYGIEAAMGRLVCHRCDNPRCVNPSHLFLGTPADNAADRDSKRRGSFGSAHYNAKLSDEQILAIRSDAGTDRAVAKHFGVSHGYVWKVRAHVKRPAAAIT